MRKAISVTTYLLLLLLTVVVNGQASEAVSDLPSSAAGSTGYAVRALSPTGGSATTNNTIWFDDALPAGAVASADSGDWWNWVSGNPAPYSGTQSHQSSATAGFHQHYFMYATGTLAVNAGETLVTY